MSNIQKKGSYLLELVMQNIKSFGGEQTLRFSDGRGNPARWTVILGENGVGKTTILECIECMLPNLNADTKEGDVGEPHMFAEPQIASADNSTYERLARIGAPVCSLKAEFARWAQLDKSPGLDSVGTSAQFVVTDGEIKTIHPPSKWPEQVEEYVLERNWTSETKFPPPFLVSYTADRQMGKENLDKLGSSRIKERVSDKNQVKTSELLDVEETLQALDYAAEKSKSKTAIAERQIVLELLTALLPSIEKPSDILIFPSIVLSGKGKTGVHADTSDGLVPFSQLSLGYQMMMAWAIDLSLRLVKNFPDSKKPLEETAIVLIDEIDLHLHPKWQREIKSILTGYFPNVQFIVTAHSPLVAQAFLDDNLVVVSREEGGSAIDDEPAVNSTWRVDQIVTSLFQLDAWPPAVVALFDEKSQLLRRSKRTKVQENRLAEISESLLTIDVGQAPEDEDAFRIIRAAAARLRSQGVLR